MWNCEEFPDFSQMVNTGSNMTVMISSEAVSAFVLEHDDLLPNAMLFAVYNGEIVGRTNTPDTPDDGDSIMGGFLLGENGYQAALSIWGAEIMPDSEVIVETNTGGNFSGFDGVPDNAEFNIYLLNGLSVYYMWSDDFTNAYVTNGMATYGSDANFELDCTIQVTNSQYSDLLIALQEAQLVTPDDGITQADVDIAWNEGADSVTPDDGITQADVDAVEATYQQLDYDLELLQGQYSELDAAFDELTDSEYDLWGSNQELQTQLDSVNSQLYDTQESNWMYQQNINDLQAQVDAYAAENGNTEPLVTVEDLGYDIPTMAIVGAVGVVAILMIKK